MKTHHNDPIPQTSGEAVHEAIAARAYALWLRAGQPEDQAEAIWLEAERELIAAKYAETAAP